MEQSRPRFTGLSLAPQVIAALEEVFPRMAELSAAAIVAEVPAYGGPLQGQVGQNVANAVQASLAAFLRLATQGENAGRDSSLSVALEGAYELGRGQVRDGRSIDVLLAAYRVGARVAWRELSGATVEAGLPAQTIAQFAELVFAYVDELSAASVSGYADELAITGRARQRYLDLLTSQLLNGGDAETLRASADTAAWPLPETLTAVLVPAAQMSRAATFLNPYTLQAAEDLPGLNPAEPWAVLLVPDAETGGRSVLLSALVGRSAVVGPSRPWLSARVSYLRAIRARHLAAKEWAAKEGAAKGVVVDTDEHLVELVLRADPDAAEDLRRRALAPLSEFSPNSADRLAQTLRSWLLHQGRRDAVAADLIVHPQTVRYRMNQIRQVYGDRLDDPEVILELTVALGMTS